MAVVKEEVVKHRQKSQGKINFGQGKVREFYSRGKMGTL